MSLITIIVVLLVVGVILWGVRRLNFDPMITNIIYVLTVIFIVVWLAQVLFGVGLGSLRVG